MEKSEESLKDLWDSVKRPNTWASGVSEIKEKEVGEIKIFEEYG